MLVDLTRPGPPTSRLMLAVDRVRLVLVALRRIPRLSTAHLPCRRLMVDHPLKRKFCEKSMMCRIDL